MPRAITCERLVKVVEDGAILKNGMVACAEGVKYDFRMSSSVLKASKGRKVDIDKLSESEKLEMAVEPGEVVFVLSEESLCLPNNVMAHLVPKRKLAHEGILVLGGFCVDPLYEGKLLVGLYNFSSTRWPLEPGRKLIAATFYELHGDELGTLEKPESLWDFPEDLVRLISAYQPVDFNSLQEYLEKLEREIKSLREDYTTDKEYRREIQADIKSLTGKIENATDIVTKLGVDLDKEKENRIAAQDDLGKEIAGLRVTHGQNTTQHANNLSFLVVILTIVGTILGTAIVAIIGGVIGWYLTS